MNAAIDVFTEDCYYDDTVFPTPFSGKESLRKHLVAVAEAFPPTFKFIVDDMANNGDAIAARWHVENNGKQMSFTRRCSFYNVDGNFIQEGFDVVEPAVWKLGALDLFVTSMKTKLAREPLRFVPLARFIPLVVWVAYIYILFFLDGIFLGANALQHKPRTWEEVRELSLNFFLVAPILNLPFSPTVHPMLEGVFNLLLSWAGTFCRVFQRRT